MRTLPWISIVAALAACSSASSQKPTPDAANHVIDAPPASVDAAPDAPPDSPPIPDGIAEARAAADGTGLTLAIHHATVTFVKPQIGSTTNDPAGFTIQAKQPGPALFVAVDPATLTPVPVAGDVVDFTITQMGTVAMQRRAQAIGDFARVSQGANLDTLVQDVSAATDLVAMIDNYDSELVTVTGTLADAPANSGAGFQRTSLQLAGQALDTNLQLRAPSTLFDAIDLAATCQVTVTKVPMGRFNAAAEVGLFDASQVHVTGCPAPAIATVAAASSTTIKFTFSRNILASTVMTDGSQFTFDGGLTASAAVVSGRSITVTTTTAQTAGKTYTFSITAGLTDLQGTALAASATNTFLGFSTPAIVRINEINANATCDMIELRVISGGSMGGFKITERTGSSSSNELNFTFPAGFTVAKNDFIVLHENGGTSCNPNSATSETATKSDQPASMFSTNYDTAFDFYMTDAGLVATNNVITLFDATGAIMDGIDLTDAGTGNTATGTNTAAAALGAAGEWLPTLTTYSNSDLRGISVPNLAATGTTVTGTTIQRINDADTNGAADWTTTPANSTWGALNAGQTSL